MKRYLQLALWHVPAVVVVGNALDMEAREVLYTPVHCLGFWDSKLRRRDKEEATQADRKTVSSKASEAVELDQTASIQPKREPARCPLPGGQEQFDFGF